MYFACAGMNSKSWKRNEINYFAIKIDTSSITTWESSKFTQKIFSNIAFSNSKYSKMRVEEDEGKKYENIQLHD